MIEHTRVGRFAFQPFHVEVRVLPKQVCAIWTTAEVHFVPGNVVHNGPFRRLFGQTGRTDNQIARFMERLRGVLGEKVSTALTAETVLLAAMAVTG